MIDLNVSVIYFLRKIGLRTGEKHLSAAKIDKII